MKGALILAITLLVIVILFLSWPLTLGLLLAIPDAPAHYDPGKPIEFFLIEEFVYDDSRTQLYLIKNAPVSEAETIGLIEDYNRRYITADMIKANAYFQTFYRKIKYNGKSFKESESYPIPATVRFYHGDEPAQRLDYYLDNDILDAYYSRTRNSRSTKIAFALYSPHRELEKEITDIYAYFADSDGNLPDYMSDTEFEQQPQ